MGTLWTVEGLTGSLTKGNFYKPNVITTSGTINAVDGNEYIIEQAATPTIQLPAITQLYQRVRITIINSPSTIIAAGGSDNIRLDNNETSSGGTITNTVLGQSIELLALVNQASSGFAWVAVNFTNQWFLNTGVLACPQNTLNADNNTLSVNFKVRQLIANNGLTVNLDWSTPNVLDLNGADVINVNSIAPTMPIPNPIITITTNYTALNTDGTILSDASAGNITLTLPLAGSVSGIIYNIKKIDSSGNTVDITPSGGQLIDGAANLIISSMNDSVTITSDGSNWWII